MKIIVSILLVAHGLIHMLGFVKGYHMADVSGLTGPISKPAGTIWLLTSIVFLASFLLLILNNNAWWVVAVLAVILSQVMISLSWTDAKFGTIANVIIIIPIIMAFANSLPSSFWNRYQAGVKERLTLAPASDIIAEQDIRHLPDPVQKYLLYVGAVGKPRIHNFRAVFRGAMKLERSGGWMNIRAQQYNFFPTGDKKSLGEDKRARLFYIQSSMFGIPFDGFHAYIGSNATMQIKVASLFQVVDAKGEKMNQGETVTLFNDMCLLAPSTLIDKKILWESVDSKTVKAKFTNQGNTIEAQLYFDENGALINFLSNDRFMSSDGKTYLNYPWSTPVKKYTDIGGRKVVQYAEATWHTPEGEHNYAKFDLETIEYNCTQFK